MLPASHVRPASCRSTRCSPSCSPSLSAGRRAFGLQPRSEAASSWGAGSVARIHAHAGSAPAGMAMRQPTERTPLKALAAVLPPPPPQSPGGGAAQGQRRGASGYAGVSWHKGSQRWRAQITREGCQIHLGSYEAKADAARAYDQAAVRVWPGRPPPNFPRAQYYEDARATVLKPEPRVDAILRGERLAGMTKAGKAKKTALEYVGAYLTGSGRWGASIKHQRASVYLGSYPSASEAARAFDKAAVRLRPRAKLQGKLNFPLEDYLDERGQPKPDPRTEAALRRWQGSR